MPIKNQSIYYIFHISDHLLNLSNIAQNLLVINDHLRQKNLRLFCLSIII